MPCCSPAESRGCKRTRPVPWGLLASLRMQARSLASGACTRIGLWRLRCSFDWVFQLEGGIRRLPSSFGCSSTGQYQDWLPIVPWPSACFNLGQPVRRPRLRGGAPPARAAQVYLAGASVAADIFALCLHRRRSPLALRKLSERCLPMPTLAVLALSFSLCCSSCQLKQTCVLPSSSFQTE